MTRHVPWLLIGISLIALACAGTNATQDGGDRLVRELDRVTQIVTKDTLHVRQLQTEDGRVEGGTPIDSKFYPNFSTVYPDLADAELNQLFGLYRMELGHGRVGYVLRVPSQYTSSKMDLWIYDHQSKRWEPPVYLADAFGDGTWSFVEEGWLVDINHDGLKDVVRRRRDGELDEWTDIPVEHDSLVIALGTRRGFKPPKASTDHVLLRTFDVQGKEGLVTTEEPVANLSTVCAQLPAVDSAWRTYRNDWMQLSIPRTIVTPIYDSGNSLNDQFFDVPHLGYSLSVEPGIASYVQSLRLDAKGLILTQESVRKQTTIVRCPLDYRSGYPAAIWVAMDHRDAPGIYHLLGLWNAAGKRPAIGALGRSRSLAGARAFVTAFLHAKVRGGEHSP